MTQFRPCIDLHEGHVKQIVGGTLDSESTGLETNFVSDKPSTWFAELYAENKLEGGHVIKLGPGNDAAATSALASYPEGLQIGGGINASNAAEWLEKGASHVIATSTLFNADGHFQEEALSKLVTEAGKERLVIDLSCRRAENGWVVAMNRWQTLTDIEVTHETLDHLCDHCDEFLIHAADVEGKCEGIDTELVAYLGNWGKCPITYAGGAASLADLEQVATLSHDRIHLTIGSALDIFGGSGATFEDCVAFNRR
jgi:phosphoribosylformimino-5-aminoimidazole carboxamide ribotide isomerase